MAGWLGFPSPFLPIQRVSDRYPRWLVFTGRPSFIGVGDPAQNSELN
jgi:hypothetical protein